MAFLQNTEYDFVFDPLPPASRRAQLPPRAVNLEPVGESERGDRIILDDEATSTHEHMVGKKKEAHI
jgi:hypothetical protein